MQSILSIPGFMTTPGGAATGYPSLLAQARRARENQFQHGILATPWAREFQQRYGEAPNLNDPDYDYRAAWAAGVRPQRYEHDGGAYHWPSVLPNGTPLKSANHPTAWMETFMRATGRDPHEFGITTPEDAQRFLSR
jgi:hypothetical protein